MGGQAGLARLGGDRRGNHRGAVFVSGVVLYDEYRTYTALLTADHRTQVGVINISSFYSACHAASLSDEIIVTLITEVLCNRATIILSQSKTKYTHGKIIRGHISPEGNSLDTLYAFLPIADTGVYPGYALGY